MVVLDGFGGVLELSGRTGWFGGVVRQDALKEWLSGRVRKVGGWIDGRVEWCYSWTGCSGISMRLAER